MINVAGIIKNSLSNGPGMRYVIFVQGCPHHCDGCHNEHTWDFKDNRLMTVNEILEDIKNEMPLIKGVTFSGGEPFEQAKELTVLAKRIKNELELDVMSYTGYTYEEIQNSNSISKKDLLENIDILVDGKFELNNIEGAHIWAGSANQKVYFFNKPTKESVIKQLKERK